MKALCIQGSPRKRGNTATVVGWVEEALRHLGHTVEHVDICERVVNGCKEDLSCQRVSDAPGCGLRDDADGIFQQMLDSDLIILASPLFCWSFPAQMKALLDRSICLCKVFDTTETAYLLEGRRMALIVTAAGPRDGNMDLIAETFDRYAEYLHCEQVGKLLVARCTRPKDLGERVRLDAQQFARDITFV